MEHPPPTPPAPVPVPPPSVPDAPAFAAEGLRVALGGQTILHDLTFAIPRGAWVGLLGPNGAGKTTLVRTLAGLLPHAGSLALLGRPLDRWSDRERARAVAVVRQQPALDFDFTVEELVALGRAPHRSWLAGPTAEDRAAVAAALAETDLGGLASRSVTTLSGGEGQRVLLAQALAQDAPILLLDEPTAHLDVHHQYDLMDRVAALEGRTVVAAFHDLAFAARYADRLLVLHEGRLAAYGPPAEVLTPALLRRVFRMDAAVEAAPEGLTIRYLAPVVSGPSSVEDDLLQKTISYNGQRTTDTMKVYTRTGDDGTTGLFGGGRVAKSHPRIAAYGTVDETNAAVGMARAALVGVEGVAQADAVLGRVQEELFVLGGDLAAPGETKYPVPRIEAHHVERLERDIDALTEGLPPLKHFILPGGHPAAAALHLARTVCRRAERLVVETAAIEEVAVEPLHYLNRLSDLLFTMARWVNHQASTGDTEWVPVNRDA